MLQSKKVQRHSPGPFIESMSTTQIVNQVKRFTLTTKDGSCLRSRKSVNEN